MRELGRSALPVWKGDDLHSKCLGHLCYRGVGRCDGLSASDGVGEEEAVGEREGAVLHVIVLDADLGRSPAILLCWSGDRDVVE